MPPIKVADLLAPAIGQEGAGMCGPGMLETPLLKPVCCAGGQQHQSVHSLTLGLLFCTHASQILQCWHNVLYIRYLQSEACAMIMSVATSQLLLAMLHSRRLIGIAPSFASGLKQHMLLCLSTFHQLTAARKSRKVHSRRDKRLCMC